MEGNSYRVVEPLKSDELEKWYKTEEIEDEDEEELIVEGDEEDELYEIGKLLWNCLKANEGTVKIRTKYMLLALFYW